ncbi:response regulator [Rhizobium sp. CNPSo 4039]|uniref:response regulator n=1 Tax=Rhizobium sp. CNPSo 4039 TaxID=3021409 RepID=UPI002549D32A|nr:response regulator [Rhizobium sp. CNPSo 4039]MDK4715429.1 response regulator [Rhizobium sp. CNPSo 4039]
MDDQSLKNLRILVVEDEYLLAMELSDFLNDAGALVIGPVGTLDDAFELIGKTSLIDGAILDINLGGEAVFPAADKLMERNVPILFTSGYDAGGLPSRFKHCDLLGKPNDMAKLRETIRRMAARPGR